MKKLALTFVLVFATVTAACSSSSDNTSSGGTSGTSADSGTGSDSATGGDSSTGADSGTMSAANAIVVKSNQFVPATLTIKAGETVTWTWAGGTHTVTSGSNCTADGAYASGFQSAVGSTFSHTFATAGTFDFFCDPHCVSAGMKGTITVQ